jgi:hypothetical protein
VLVGKFAAPAGGEHSLVFLNRGPDPKDLRVAQLNSDFDYFRAIWNRQGDDPAGQTHELPRVRSDHGGGVTVTVRSGEMLALSTHRLTR